MCQSLSTASSAPPILQQGFHILAACVPLAHLLSVLKASYYPPTYAGYGRTYTSRSYYIASKSVSVFAVIDIAYHYYSVIHNVLELRPLGRDNAPMKSYL